MVSKIEDVAEGISRIEEAICTINHNTTATAEATQKTAQATERIAEHQKTLNSLLEKLVDAVCNKVNLPWKWIIALTIGSLSILAGIIGVKLILGI